MSIKFNNAKPEVEKHDWFTPGTSVSFIQTNGLLVSVIKQPV